MRFEAEFIGTYRAAVVASDENGFHVACFPQGPGHENLASLEEALRLAREWADGK